MGCGLQSEAGPWAWLILFPEPKVHSLPSLPVGPRVRGQA